MIDAGPQTGEESIVISANRKGPDEQSLVAIKFFRDKAAYDVEVDFFYSNIESPYVPQVACTCHAHTYFMQEE